MIEQVEAKNIVESWYENYDPEDKNNYLIDIIETIDALMCDKNFSLVDEICSKLFNDKNELTIINLTVLCVTDCSLSEYNYKYRDFLMDWTTELSIKEKGNDSLMVGLNFTNRK